MPPEAHLITLSLALEDALTREAWEEADELFIARENWVLAQPKGFHIPHEVDEIDQRMLAHLRSGMDEIRRTTRNLDQRRQVGLAYTGASSSRVALSAA